SHSYQNPIRRCLVVMVSLGRRRKIQPRGLYKLLTAENQNNGSVNDSSSSPSFYELELYFSGIFKMVMLPILGQLSDEYGAFGFDKNPKHGWCRFNCFSGKDAPVSELVDFNCATHSSKEADAEMDKLYFSSHLLDLPATIDEEDVAKFTDAIA
ncbi:hypothetical protein M8C21_015488, partial [Ambrosia artemisiifolia]